jgi:phage terminase large subunit GpA-like protein
MTSTNNVRQIRPPTLEELAASAKFKYLEDIVAQAFSGLQPPSRLTVTQAGVNYTKLAAGGGSSVSWSESKTPYLRQPQDVLTSLDHTGMIFLGPARTGKTVMLLNWVSHTVKCDPTDMLLVHMDRENARKWSKGDLDRYLLASTAIRAEQLTSRQHDNTFDKTFRSGMRILITYPTPANLSGITVKNGAAIDYDRCEDDIGGEGPLFDLLSMRTTTYGRFAMAAAESSPNPNKEIQDPRWMPSSPHAAPPIRGIFELYNRGDRRRWQWCCPQCDQWFEPDFKLLDWGGLADPMEARDVTVMICPNNGCIIKPHLKDELNRHGQWIREGEMIEPGRDGAIVPRPGMKVTRSSYASFWLKGPAAAYQNWGQLVEKYIRAMIALDETGDDAPLRKTVTTDQGTWYVPQNRLSEIAPEQLKNKAEDWGSEADNPTVPMDVRTLIGTADVQKMAFVCQVHGFTDSGDMVVVDSFKIRLSNRLNANGERLPIDPAAYGEDWDLIDQELMRRTYELADNSGRRMKLRATAVDSGGAEGVTGHAYNFWRRLRERRDGSHQRLILVKGTSTPGAPLARTTWPDSSQKDKNAVARGDVPVLILQSNALKDRVSLLLNRRVATDGGVGGGSMRYPDWLENWFYTQLTSEVRSDKGWENTKKRRNEAFDLAYYALGVALRPLEPRIPFIHFGVDRSNWIDQSWSALPDDNDFVYLPSKDGEPEVVKSKPTPNSFSALGKKLG